MIRVLLADDHILVREGLRALLTKEADIQVVAEAGDGHDALRAARETRPDVAALDLSMPLLNGLEAARQMPPGHSPHGARGGSVRLGSRSRRGAGLRPQEAGRRGSGPGDP
jgi:DNA-binding NarL/FixJ family response regulator